jgi:hypothetical protein
MTRKFSPATGTARPMMSTLRTPICSSFFVLRFLTSYAGEPFLLSVLHLNKPLREHSSAWILQAYLLNLEADLSTKKQQYSHRYLTRGMSNCNYDKIMDAVLQGILAIQKRGGLKLLSRWAM